MKRLLAFLLIFSSTTLAENAYKVTVLSTNIADYGGLGEWSFSALFEGEDDSVLFDTGFKRDTVLHNVLHLGVDLSSVEKVVLSHYHSDHTGGLLVLREHFRRENPAALSKVYVAKGFFDQRRTAEGRLVGPGDFDTIAEFKEAAEAAGITFIVVDSPTQIAPALWITGPVPREIESYNGPKGLFIETTHGPIPDIIHDDQSLGYLTDRGWMMTSGCGHAGLMNTGEALKKIKDAPIYSIMGGFHLWQAENSTLDKTARWLQKAGLTMMMGGHCTGIAAAENIASTLRLPRPHISHAAVGSVITPELKIIRSSVE